MSSHLDLRRDNPSAPDKPAPLVVHMPERQSPAVLDARDWLQYPHRVGTPCLYSARLLPDFLVVSPPRTGTTWLFENLRRHPQICMARIKEVRYFDRGWRTHAIDTYCQNFADAGGRVKGEASPSYALLPDVAIAHIKAVKPDLKIVVTLREPLERAWSHLKHMFRFREASFAGLHCRFDQLSFLDYVRGVVHDYALSSGDYGAILRRWLKHFPKSQFHFVFIDKDVRKQRQSLSDLFDFLGVSRAGGYPAVEIAYRGRPERIFPEIAPWLHAAYDTRRSRLENLLRTEFGLVVPWPAPAARRVGRLGLPSLAALPGWSVELNNGWFEGRRDDGAESNRAGARTPTDARAEFMGDLLLDLKPGANRCEALSRAGWSNEDCRLARVLDGLVHSLRPLSPVLAAAASRPRGAPALDAGTPSGERVGDPLC